MQDFFVHVGWQFFSSLDISFFWSESVGIYFFINNFLGKFFFLLLLHRWATGLFFLGKYWFSRPNLLWSKTIAIFGFTYQTRWKPICLTLELSNYFSLRSLSLSLKSRMNVKCGSTINTDRFSKWAQKAQACRRVRGHPPPGKCSWILTP